MAKKRIRGLLDYATLKEGEDWEWEWEPPSETYMPGLGLGATPEAHRLAYKGYEAEYNDLVKKSSQPTLGRPKTGQYHDINCRRAFFIWWEVKDWPVNRRRIATNRELIERMRNLTNNEMRVKYWPDRQSLEQSISRGRKKLKIDNNWNSKVCEKILHYLEQTTDG